MEIYFNQDAFHRYMTTGVIEEDGDAGFEEKMLDGLDSPFFLPFLMRITDRKKEYCYDITGLTDLETYIKSGRVDSECLRMIISSLLSVFDAAAAYLLDIDSILLEPGCVYLDKDRSRLLFAYVPGSKEKCRDGLRQVAQMVLSAVDYRQNAAVLMAYDFYRIVSQTDFSVNMLRDIGHVRTEDEPEPQEEEEGEQEVQAGGESPSYYEEPDHEIPAADPEPVKKKEASKGRWDVFLPAAAALAYGFLIILLYKGGILGSAARAAGIRTRYLALALLAAGGAAAFFLARGQRKKDEEETVPGEENYDEAEFDPAPEREEGGENRIFTYEDFSLDRSDETVFLGASGETTVLGQDPSLHFPKLISLDREKTGDLVFVKLPAVIGARRPGAQVLIGLPGISRTHALLEADKGRFLISDLGSTNGTYLNGEKLVPDRRYDLKEGDQLQLANAAYTFRER